MAILALHDFQEENRLFIDKGIYEDKTMATRVLSLAAFSSIARLAIITFADQKQPMN
jgi:hypothetical protein